MRLFATDLKETPASGDSCAPGCSEWRRDAAGTGRRDACPTRRRAQIWWAGIALIALLSLLVPSAAKAQMTVRIVNQNAAYTDANVFFRFGGANAITGTINGQPIQLGTNYSIAQIGSGLQITSFTGGAKIFIALGTPFGSGDVNNNFNPNFANSSLPDFYTRWDKVELSYLTTDPSSLANLSADDFASIPMRLTVGDESLGWFYKGTMQSLLSSLAALSGNDNRAVVTTNGQIVRVISPHTVFVANWPSFEPYLDFIRTNSITTSVAGTFYGRAPFNLPELQQQTYNLAASINASTNLVLTGTCGVVGATTITISNADLLEAVYSANPPYVVNGVYTNNYNSVFDAAVRDILAGFNLGLVGTSRLDPRTGVPFTNETTQVWYNYPANGTVTTSLEYTNVFEALWNPGVNFYNQYASILSTNTAAYSFPFNDTLANPLVSLANNPTLEIDILPDTNNAGGLQPSFAGITVTNNQVNLSIVNLAPGTTYSVDSTPNLHLPMAWESVAVFTAASATTNYALPMGSGMAIYRLRTITP